MNIEEVRIKVYEGKILSEIPLLKELYLKIFQRQDFKNYSADFMKKCLNEGFLTSTKAFSLLDYVHLKCPDCNNSDITALFSVEEELSDRKKSQIKQTHVGDLCGVCKTVGTRIDFIN
ncbi:MAG: hypothetical protein AABW67_04375 [Nanoarchaeota archaeon]